MSIDALVDSLLFEGYALYPYTPGATKNATPTPFGIVYPPAYADGRSTFDRARVDCMVEADPGATARGRGALPAARRRASRGEPRALVLPPAAVGGETVSVDEASRRYGAPLALRATLAARGRRARPRHASRREPQRGAGGIDRGAALARSVLSTHPLLRLAAGRFLSPLEVGAGCDSVNTWPVLATPQDDVMLGAAIVLPDHPQLAPESLGGLFDSTEIEEALLLHVQALSDGERAEIAAETRPCRDGRARRAAAPEDVLRLHGRVELRDPADRAEPPASSPTLRDPTRGEAQVTVDGRTFRRGDSVSCGPARRPTSRRGCSTGRSATIERIYVDLDGKVHLGVTRRGRARPGAPARDEQVPVLLPTRGGGDGMTLQTASRSWSPGSATPGCATTRSAAPSPSG